MQQPDTTLHPVEVRCEHGKLGAVVKDKTITIILRDGCRLDILRPTLEVMLSKKLS